MTSEILQRVLNPDLCTAHILLQQIVRISIKENKNMLRTNIKNKNTICKVTNFVIVPVQPNLNKYSIEFIVEFWNDEIYFTSQNQSLKCELNFMYFLKIETNAMESLLAYNFTKTFSVLCYDRTCGIVGGNTSPINIFQLFLGNLSEISAGRWIVPVTSWFVSTGF